MEILSISCLLQKPRVVLKLCTGWKHVTCSGLYLLDVIQSHRCCLSEDLNVDIVTWVLQDQTAHIKPPAGKKKYSVSEFIVCHQKNPRKFCLCQINFEGILRHLWQELGTSGNFCKFLKCKYLKKILRNFCRVSQNLKKPENSFGKPSDFCYSQPSLFSNLFKIRRNFSC